MKKKLLAMTLASAMLASALAGCGGSSASTDNGGSSADSGDAYNISVIVKLTDGHFNKVMAGAKAYADEHDNVNVDIQSPTSATSYDEQVNMIETSLATRVLTRWCWRRCSRIPLPRWWRTPIRS